MEDRGHCRDQQGVGDQNPDYSSGLLIGLGHAADANRRAPDLPLDETPHFRTTPRQWQIAPRKGPVGRHQGGHEAAHGKPVRCLWAAH